MPDPTAGFAAGRLTDAQRPILERRIRSLRWTYLGISGVALALAAVFSLGLYSEIGADGPLLLILGMDAFIALLLLPVIWRMRREIRKVRDDLTDSRIASVTGTLSMATKGTVLFVGGQWFPPPQSLAGIDWHATYTVSYAPRSRVIVNMEKQGQ